MSPVDAIDRELAKLSHALKQAILAEDHARHSVLVDEYNDLLDRRLAERAKP